VNEPQADEPRPADDDDDQRLLRLAGGGDGRAFRKLVDRHADRMYRLAVSLVGNRTDAEDVLQEAFAGAYKSAGGFRGGSSVKTWLSRILATQAAKWWRDRKGERNQPLDESAGPTAGGGEAAAGAKMDLHAALAQLSPEHRQVLVLRELDGMSYEEMAASLGVPRGTIESRLHRARAELRRQLTAYGRPA
jgi:RNA polymerase sigma-70 factor (ECF subfamily)